MLILIKDYYNELQKYSQNCPWRNHAINIDIGRDTPLYAPKQPGSSPPKKQKSALLNSRSEAVWGNCRFWLQKLSKFENFKFRTIHRLILDEYVSRWAAKRHFGVSHLALARALILLRLWRYISHSHTYSLTHFHRHGSQLLCPARR